MLYVVGVLRRRPIHRRVPSVLLLSTLITAIPASLAGNAPVRDAAVQRSGSPSICARLAVRWRKLRPRTLAAGFTPEWSRTLGVLVPQSNTLRDQGLSSRIAPLWDAASDYGTVLPWNSTPVSVMHAPRTSLYMAQAIAGSGACQALLFVTAGRSGRVRVVRMPPGAATLCARDGQIGTLATVLGRPAYVEYLQRDVFGFPGCSAHITVWRRGGWGGSCRITVQLTHRYALAQRFCNTERKVCSAAAAAAVAQGERYHAYRNRMLDAPRGGFVPVPRFQSGLHVSAHLRALVAQVRRIRRSEIHDLRSSSGGPAQVPAIYGYYPHDMVFLPLRLAGGVYVAGLGALSWPGHAMFVLYGTPRRHSSALRALAGFVLNWTVTGARVRRW